jgi:plasmid replication initiation protein
MNMTPKTELVVKSNKLIEASYRLTLVEQQIILYAICKAREEQKCVSCETPVTILASDFASKFNANPIQVYGQLKKAINTLYERSISIIEVDQVSGKQELIDTRWISDKSYISGAGKIKLTFTPRVIPFITRLGEDGEFTSYKIEKIGKMTSVHAIRIYELLVQYLSIGNREIEIDWLKKSLKLEEQYNCIKNLKVRVINVAMEQINKHSDITVSYDQKKSGRTITHFIFSIKAKPKKDERQDQASKKINRKYVEKHARPGESYEQAFSRLTR